MKENWYALAISIITNKPIKTALKDMGIRQKVEQKKPLNLTKEQASNIKFLLKTMSWNQLGEQFGIYGDSLRQQVDKALRA